MNDRIPAASALEQSIQLSREPLPASTKTYLAGSLHPELRVPMRAIALSNGECITVYDASGPYTDARDRKSTRLNSSHIQKSRMPSSA